MNKIFKKAGIAVIMRNVIMFLTGVLISEWITIFKDLSFLENSLLLLLVCLAIKVGFIDGVEK